MIHPCCCDVQTISVLQPPLHLRAWGLDKAQLKIQRPLYLHQNGRGETSGGICQLGTAEFEELEHPHGMQNCQQHLSASTPLYHEVKCFPHIHSFLSMDQTPSWDGNLSQQKLHHMFPLREIKGPLLALSL